MLILILVLYFRLEPVFQFGRAGKVERGLRLGQVFANHSPVLA